MKLFEYFLFALVGLVLGVVEDGTLSVNALTTLDGDRIQTLDDVVDLIEKRVAPISDFPVSELIEKVIENSGGETPYEVSPERNFAAYSRSEQVASVPSSEAEAYMAFNYAGLAYCLPSSVVSMRCKACRRLGGGVEVMEVFSDSGTRGRAYLLLDKHRREIVLAFRGSLFLENWVTNLEFIKTSVPYSQNAKVHTGFLRAINILMRDIKGPLREALNQYSSYKFLITGHSLGGSLSTLAASDLLYRRIISPSRLKVITFGEPRTGNLAFARWYNTHPAHITRVVNENDIVPHVLPTIAGFAHHATEMYIHNNRSNICKNNVIEDLRCSLSRFPELSIANHLKGWDFPTGIFAC